MSVRTIAIHLPQFHPIAENDVWWGKGFTEWTNVTRAVKRFARHEQPRLPADLGFVDMRLPEARAAQADLARSFGIHGFCYYHYWFEGHRLIHRPFEEILASGEPDFPFCLCWANETWSRRWLGEEREILMKQTYSMGDHVEHARWLCAAFADRRYIRVHGRPLFLVYRPLDIPELERALVVYRETALRELGCDIYLVGVDGHRPGEDFRAHGFDHTMNFRPQLGLVPGVAEEGFSVRQLLRNLRLGTFDGQLKTIDYAEFIARMEASTPAHGHYFSSVLVGWDNTARRGAKGIVVTDASPALFRRQVANTLEKVVRKPVEEQLLFVNAWNEWAEGNHLEPDLRHGRGYLEALRAALVHRAVPTWTGDGDDFDR
jgi:lipopolysaccharide biosynthesis protein